MSPDPDSEKAVLSDSGATPQVELDAKLVACTISLTMSQDDLINQFAHLLGLSRTLLVQKASQEVLTRHAFNDPREKRTDRLRFDLVPEQTASVEKRRTVNLDAYHLQLVDQLCEFSGLSRTTYLVSATLLYIVRRLWAYPEIANYKLPQPFKDLDEHYRKTKPQDAKK